MEFYREMNEKNIHMPNEAEFQAYYILTHAYSNETASKAETLPERIFYDPQVQFALEIQSMMARTNEEYIQGRASENGSLNLFSAFFRKLQNNSTSYLMACCMHLNFIDIRRGALKAMQKAYYCFPDDNSSVWPINELMILLGYDSEEEVMETLDYYEIPYENGVALIGKQINEQKMNKGNFTGIIICINSNRGPESESCSSKIREDSLRKEERRIRCRYHSRSHKNISIVQISICS